MQPNDNTSDDIPRKQCTKCKQWFLATAEFFHRNRRQKDGLYYWCKDCNNAHVRAWNEANREYKKERDREAYRANPERYKRNNRRWRAANPERKLKADRRWRAKNKEKIGRQRRRTERARYYRDRSAAIAKVQRKQARKRELPDTLTNEQWESALSYFNGCCAVCERPLGLFHTLAMDHWIPLASDDCPGTVADNVVPLCHGVDGCNNSKNAHDPEDWLIEKFGKRKADRILERIEAYFEIVGL